MCVYLYVCSSSSSSSKSIYSQTSTLKNCSKVRYTNTIVSVQPYHTNTYPPISIARYQECIKLFILEHTLDIGHVEDELIIGK